MLFAVSCVLESQTITQSLLPHISERFIYSCKSYFKWLTSKLLVYRAKWGAASPFQSSPLFSFLLLLLLFFSSLSVKLSCRVRQTWSLWECEPSVKWEEVSFFIFSSRHFASFLKEGKALHCSCNDSALQHTFRWWITHKYVLTKAWRSTWKCLFTAQRPVTCSVSQYGKSRYIHFALEVWMDSKALSSLTFKWPSAVYLYMCGKTSSSIYFCNFSLFFIGTGAAKMM